MISLFFHRHAPLLVAALVVFPLLSCVEAESEICAWGKVCGPGLRCAAIQETCISTPCGDGVVQNGELCDDGNVQSGDGCSRDCMSTERCGDDRVDLDAGEVCDDGNTNPNDGCSSDCKSTELCGNGTIDETVGEVCDDKNIKSGDGCSSNCRSDEQCGNNILDTAAGEVCDDGNTVNGDKCSSDCLSGEECGNGVLDSGEDCDDGNFGDNDGCPSTCNKAYCGDGFVFDQEPGQEQCDTSGESATCNGDCTKAKCGDGIVNSRAGEECDDGDTINENDCLNNCHWARCGDGVEATLATTDVLREECDDRGESLRCDLDCTLAECGDRVVNSISGEECDTGGEETRTCTKQCRISRCGDGYVNGVANEQCDDGNADQCGTCSPMCFVMRTATQARGSIQACSGNELQDGETFVLDDGGRSLIFEFTSDETVEDSEDTKYIVRGSSDSARDVATAIKNKINDVNDRGELGIRAFEIPGQNQKIELVHSLKTFFGNQRIVESVRNIRFVVQGMSGGSAGDCPAGMGCRSLEDCAPGLSCNSSGTCQ